MYFDYMLPDAILIYSLQYAMTFHITSVLSLAIHLFHKKLSYHRFPINVPLLPWACLILLSR